MAGRDRPFAICAIMSTRIPALCPREDLRRFAVRIVERRPAVAFRAPPMHRSVVRNVAGFPRPTLWTGASLRVLAAAFWKLPAFVPTKRSRRIACSRAFAATPQAPGATSMQTETACGARGRYRRDERRLQKQWSRPNPHSGGSITNCRKSWRWLLWDAQSRRRWSETAIGVG